MIDWTKRLETVDGREARLVKTHHNELWHLVWVAPEYEGHGDVYMVNAEGCRCDSRSIEMGLQTSQFIRNARVKREGWVLVEPPIDKRSLLLGMLATKHIYPTEQEAMRAKDYYGTPAGTKPVPFQWEE